tara:strand:+ start:535 stop:708 length:174 start_codon:yes stop_codon:yes gene_type:complete
MWVMIWFMFHNNSLEHYVLGQYLTSDICKQEQKEALVLIKTSQTVVICLEIMPEQKR